MQAATMKRYQVRNLDCAACAAKLENNLKKMDGVDDAVIDFAGLTLHIQARDMDRIQEMVRRIEPELELIPIAERAAPATDLSLSLVRPSSTAIVACGGASFNPSTAASRTLGLGSVSTALKSAMPSVWIDAAARRRSRRW